MSLEIDERIVELRFDNDQFEEGVDQSISTLDRLKKALDIDGSQALKSLYSASLQVTESFSVMEEIAKSALANIGLRAEEAAEQLIKSVSIDQFSAGWEKFEEKTRAVQTIMSATGDDIETVNGYLEKLMWFTDETSYNFVDMTSNIGKFTAQQVPLDRATNAMIGIANWAALAGQGANEASRAMYNLAQSLGSGYVKFQDWMSVINANMDIGSFKERVIEVAKELGTLSAEAETANGNLVTIQSFGENLTQDKWFTSDVLIKVLEEYGEYADIVYQIHEETGEATSDIMAALEGMYEGVGEAAFKAGQEAKTFSDVLDATKDAVSSAWLTTFETIFGNYEEAKVMWTDLANGLYEVFAEPINARNEMLAAWKDSGGRDVLLEGLYAMASKLVGVLNAIRDIWQDVFPPKTSEELLSITEGFTNFWTNLELTEPAAEALRTILHSLFTIIKTGTDIVAAFWNSLGPVANAANQLAGAFVIGLSSVAAWVDEFLSGLEITQKAGSVFGGAGEVIEAFSNIIIRTGETLSNLASEVEYVLGRVFDHFRQSFEELIKLPSNLPFGESLKAIMNTITDFVSNGDLDAFVNGLLTTFINAFHTMGDAIDGANNAFYQIMMTVAAFSFGSEFNNTLKQLMNFVKSIKSMFTIDVAGIGENLNKVLGSLNGAILEFKKGGGINYYLKVAASIAAVSIALKILSGIDQQSLATATLALGSTMLMMSKFTQSLKVTSGVSLLDVVGIATAISTLAGALKTLSGLETDDIIHGLIGLGGVMLELAAFMKLTEKLTSSTKDVAGLLLLAMAINALILPLTVFALIPVERLAQAVIALGVIFGELAGFSALMSKTGNKELLASAASITLMSGGILVLAGAVAALSLIPFEKLATGVLGFGVMLAELSGACYILSKLDVKNVLGAALAIDMIGAAMLPLIGSVMVLSTLDLPSAAIALGSLAVMLGEMVIAMKAMEKVGKGGLAGGAGMAAMALGLTMLIPAFITLGNLSLGTIAKGLIAMAGALGIFVAAAALANNVVPGVLALGAALTGLTAGIGLILTGVGELLSSMDHLLVTFMALSTMTKEEAKVAADNMLLFMKTIAQGVVDMEAEFSAAWVSLFSTIVTALIQVIPDVIEALVSAITQLCQTIAEHGPDFVAALITILQCIRDNIYEVSVLAAEIVALFFIGVIDGITDWTPDLIDAAVRLIETLGNELWNAIVKMGKDLVVKAKEVAKDIWHGFTSGFNFGEREVVKAAEHVGAASIEGLRTGVDAHSDSQLAIPVGKDVAGGLKTGLFKSIPSVKEKAVETAKKGVIDPLKEKLNTNEGNKLGTDYLQSVIDGIAGKKSDLTNTSVDVTESASDAAIKAASDKEVGKTITKKVAKEIDEDKELEKKIKEKAQEIADIFSTEFKKIDISLSNIGYDFDIWKAIQGPEAKESVLKQGELAQAEKQLQEYAKQYQIAYDNYKYLVENPELVQSPTELAEKQSEYMKYLAQMYKQAESIAEMQKEMADDYKAGMELVREEIVDLQNKQASLVPKDFKYSEETERAYQSYLNAATDAQKQYFYEIWRELANQDYDTMGLPKIDAEGLKKEVLKDLGIDPDNAVEGYINVEETVANLIAQTGQAYVSGLEESYRWVIGTYSETINEGTQQILEDVKGQYPEYEKMGEKMGESTASGINKSAPSVARAGVAVNNETVLEMEQHYEDWESVGEGMMDGIRKGIANRRSAVIEEAIEVALAALAAAKNALGIASPSKKFAELGAFSAMGFALGLANTKDNVEDAATNVAESAVDPIFKAGQLVQNMFDDVDPVMTPVVDLSQVQRSISALDEMWGETSKKITSDISMSEANRNAEAMDSKKVEPQNITYNETFNQNNYSPKALSAIEIYRQTNNQFNMRRRGNK